MGTKEQVRVFHEVLEEFQSQGVLQDLMLIGSWCLYFYHIEFGGDDRIPQVRTLDLDFLVPANKRISKEVDIPEMLKRMGFVSNFNRSSGLIVYDHPDLRVEFLIPELGRGHSEPQNIEKLHVKAQGLRYLSLLADHPRVITDGKLRVRVPEPAVYALHKLIVTTRRKNPAKGKKDLETAIGLLDFLYKRPSEIARIKSILKDLPKPWLKTILSVSAKHFPRLNQT